MASTNKQNKNKTKPSNNNKKESAPATKMANDKKSKKGKKSANGPGSLWCKMIFGSFLLFSAFGGLIAYDTHVLHNGVFEESQLGQVLKQTGALPHVENAWMVSMKYGARGFKWTEENAPIAYSKTKVFLEPYCDLAKDLGLTTWNGAKKGWEQVKQFAAEKTPVVLALIDNYVPGLGQKIENFTVSAFNGICSFTCNGWRASVDFIKTKVLVDRFSPENIGKAFNSTTQKALTYYSWFHEKVDTYAKIK